jgi:peptide/nickel transport system substrate-binding protein
MRSVRYLAPVLATLAILLGACSGGQQPAGGGSASPTSAAKATPGGTVVFALEDDPIDFDPLRSRAFIDRNVHYQIYDSLVRIDSSGKIVPWLAEKWDIAPDGKSITFTLRKDVKFHDGSVFDADSVKWNIERYIKTTGSARSGELASVDTLTVVDANTVKFNLKAPFAPLLANLVDRAGMMVSRKAFEAATSPDDFTRKAFKAGTGPFMLTEAVKNDHITLEKNPTWWGKDKDGSALPYLDKITIKPITDGSVRVTNLKTNDAQVANNVAPKDVAGLKTDSSVVYQEKPGLSFGSLIPNEKEGFIFNERRYVKAVSMAIDRKEILDKVFFGIGAIGYGTIAPSHFAYDPNFKPFEKPDPDGAKKLVQDVGKGKLQFELLVSSGDATTLQLAQLMQAQLLKADIQMDITQLQFAEILKLQNDHTFKGLTLIGWSGRIDPDGNTYDHIYSGRPFNDSGYTNKDVDKFLDEQRSTSDQEKRKTALRAAEKLYAADDPARIWYRFGVAQLVTVTKFKGLEPYPDQIIRFQYGWLQK